MKALLIIVWVGGQAQIPVPDIVTCQMLGATVYSEQATDIICASTETMDPKKGIDL